MDAIGIGPYGRAGNPNPTSSLPAHPPGKPDATHSPKNPTTTAPGAASGANPDGLYR